jgi:hypothetical protein
VLTDLNIWKALTLLHDTKPKNHYQYIKLHILSECSKTNNPIKFIKIMVDKGIVTYPELLHQYHHNKLNAPFIKKYLESQVDPIILKCFE